MKITINRSKLLFLCTALLLTAAPLHAQGGCVNSPENPTAVLALAGSAGGLLSVLRAQWKARRKSSLR